MPNRKRKSASRKSQSSMVVSTTTGVAADERANAKSHSNYLRFQMCLNSLGRNLNPFPSSWRCIMTSTMKGFISAASAATGSFQVKGNSVYLPWNSSVPFPNPITAVATTQPAGFNGLLSSIGPYLAFRCYGSSCRVRISQENNADAMFLTLAPYVGADFSTITRAASSRWAVSTTCSIGNGRNTLTSTLATTAVSGDAPPSVEQSGFAGAYNSDPTFLFNWSLWYSLATTTSASILYEVEVAYDVVLENPQYDQADLDDVAKKRASAEKAVRDRMKKEEDARVSALVDMELEDSVVQSSSLSSSSAVSKTSSRPTRK